jgi:hypothetical protein
MLFSSNRMCWVVITLVIIFPAVFIGCGPGGAPSTAVNFSPTPVMTSQSATSLASTTTTPPAPAVGDILNGSIKAWAGLSTYQYEINMALKTSVSTSGKVQNINLNLSGNGMNNLTVNEMQMNANMEIEAPGQGKISMPMELYLANGWQYTKISVPLSGDQWIKMKMDMSSYDARDDIQHVIELWQSSSNVSVIGSESVNGTSCHVLQVTPDVAELTKWLKSVQQTSSLTQQGQPAPDSSRFIKNISFKVWVARDTNLMKKSETMAVVAMIGTDLGATAQPGDFSNADIAQTIIITRYNSPVSIVLPPESQSAQDVTPKT